MKTFELRRRDDQSVLIPQLEIAATFGSRLRGLQFRRRLEAGVGLLLIPCNSIHTCFVRFSLDAAFLSNSGEVLEVRKGIRPWRFAGPVKGARYVVEYAAGTAQIVAGERVGVACHAEVSKPLARRLQGLLLE